MQTQDIDQIWSNYNIDLFKFIIAKVNDKFDAEDILQDVFIKAYKNIEFLDQHESLKSWLYKITSNTIIDYYRKKKYTPVDMEQSNDVQEIPAETMNMNDEMVKCMHLFIQRLPDKYKDPLEMYAFNGMKHREISEKLDISLSGSKTRVQCARDMLKEELTNCCKVDYDVYGNIINYAHKKKCPYTNMNC